MEELKIIETKSTPYIYANPNGEITIEGVSIPENVVDFYAPLNEWVDKFKLAPSSTITCNIKLVYFNTVTAIIIANFLKSLCSLHPEKYDLTVNWFYEKNDLEIEESGNDFKSFIPATFNMIQID